MSLKPIPDNLAQVLPNARTPWHTSPQVFPRLQFAVHQTDPYTKCELTPKDPEWNFVTTYFGHDAPQNPRHKCIRRIFCIHNPSSTTQFESKIPTMEQEAKNPYFAPSWHKEDELPLRTQAFSRWQDTAQPFSPFFITSASGRKDLYQETKIVPLWHGSTAEKCDSVCKTGFTFFGKHDPQDLANTDIGFFGSGIYFTNSARYAADIYSQGHIFLAWVSMREPFPVVSDKAVLPPHEPKDMQLLKGKGAYKNYNAHYVPAISINPANPQCPIYYPCAQGQAPMCDEYVVFQPAQTLARFWVELGPLPESSIALEPALATPINIAQMLDRILTLLDNPSVQQSDIGPLLAEKSHEILTLDDQTPLSPKNLEFYNCIQKLLSEAGQVRGVVQQKLLQLAPMPPAQQKIPQAAAKVVAPIPMQPAAAKVAALPPIAFGRAKWEQYFGLKVIEPPLPPDIDKILAGPCPIFPGKRVAETHFLKLIPEDMTLERLESLTQNPKQGSKMGFRDKDYKYVKLTLAQHGRTSSGRAHWVLMTNDVIPDSRSKNWKDQQTLAAKFKGQGYQLLSGVDVATCLLLEYVETGRRFYTDSPYTYTRCVEQVKVDSSQWLLAIGGFAPGGVYVNSYDVGYDRVGVGLARQFL